MKKIEAVIKPFKIDDVKEALEKVGVRGITISDAKGLGRQRGFTEVNTGVEYGAMIVGLPAGSCVALKLCPNSCAQSTRKKQAFEEKFSKQWYR